MPTEAAREKPTLAPAGTLQPTATPASSSGAEATAIPAEAPTPQPTVVPTAAIVRKGNWTWTTVTKAEFGADWPLVVGEGKLACNGRNGVGDVVFSVSGTIYAVNGAARGRKENGQKIYAEIDPIWANHPSVEGLKKDISPLIYQGLELCK